MECKKVFSKSRYVIILLICIGIATYFLFQHKPSGFIPSEDDGLIYVTYELPEASSTTQSVDVMTQINEGSSNNSRCRTLCSIGRI